MFFLKKTNKKIKQYVYKMTDVMAEKKTEDSSRENLLKDKEVVQVYEDESITLQESIEKLNRSLLKLEEDKKKSNFYYKSLLNKIEKIKKDSCFLFSQNGGAGEVDNTFYYEKFEDLQSEIITFENSEYEIRVNVDSQRSLVEKVETNLQKSLSRVKGIQEIICSRSKEVESINNKVLNCLNQQKQVNELYLKKQGIHKEALESLKREEIRFNKESERLKKFNSDFKVISTDIKDVSQQKDYRALELGNIIRKISDVRGRVEGLISQRQKILINTQKIEISLEEAKTSIKEEESSYYEAQKNFKAKNNIKEKLKKELNSILRQVESVGDKKKILLEHVEVIDTENKDLFLLISQKENEVKIEKELINELETKEELLKRSEATRISKNKTLDQELLNHRENAKELQKKNNELSRKIKIQENEQSRVSKSIEKEKMLVVELERKVTSQEKTKMALRAELRKLSVVHEGLLSSKENTFQKFKLLTTEKLKLKEDHRLLLSSSKALNEDLEKSSIELKVLKGEGEALSKLKDSLKYAYSKIEKELSVSEDECERLRIIKNEKMLKISKLKDSIKEAKDSKKSTSSLYMYSKEDVDRCERRMDLQMLEKERNNKIKNELDVKFTTIVSSKKELESKTSKLELENIKLIDDSNKLRKMVNDAIIDKSCQEKIYDELLKRRDELIEKKKKQTDIHKSVLNHQKRLDDRINNIR